MQFRTFFERFGGSLRTRNLKKRPYPLPKTSELPTEFIRLCPWEAEYLYAVARRAKRGILEIGRFNGGSCFLLSCAAPDVPIYSIDISPRDDELLRRQFAATGVGANVSLIIGDSQNSKFPDIEAFDLLFIDGDHSYDGCGADIRNWYGDLLPHGHLLFHDCYLGQIGVQDAVLDFIADHRDLETIRPPFIGMSTWQYSAGSIAHFVKRGEFRHRIDPNQAC